MHADQIPASVYLDAGRAHAVAIGDPDNEWYWKTQASMAGHQAAVESAYRAGQEASALLAKAGYEVAVFMLREVARRTGSPAAEWAAEYLDTSTARQVAAIDPAAALRRHAATAPRDPEGRWTSDDR